MTSLTTQLEIAAHWLEEAALSLIATRGDIGLVGQLRRVKHDCLDKVRQANAKQAA